MARKSYGPNVKFVLRSPMGKDQDGNVRYRDTPIKEADGLPGPGREFEVGGQRYLASAVKRPLIEDWHRYDLAPPVVWAEEINKA